MCALVIINLLSYYTGNIISGKRDKSNLKGEVSRERCHYFTNIWLDNSGKHGDRSRDSLFAQESKDTKLSKTAVVDFGSETLCLGLWRLVLGSTKGIEKVERDLVWNIIKSGVGTWLSTLGVMNLAIWASKFRIPFQESDKGNDLDLGNKRKSIPLFRRRKIGRRVGDSRRSQGPGEDKVGLDNVSNKGSHGDTSVLDLGLAKPSNSTSFVQAPVSGTDKIKRVVEFDNRVELGGHFLEVGLHVWVEVITTRKMDLLDHYFV
jgi:hypothetical protein